MDLFSEQLVRGARDGLAHDIARVEVVGRHVAVARLARRPRSWSTRRRPLLISRRRGPATAPALNVRGAAPSPSR